MPATMQLSSNKWLRFFNQPPNPRLRIFCLPYAGGGSMQYRPWARALPEDLQLAALVFPGREERMREPCINRMAPLVAALVDALGPFLDRPFVLYGHSMGGLISYELAHALRRSLGVEPARLIVSGRGAPDTLPNSDLHQLPDKEFVNALNLRYGGIPQVLLNEPELLAMFVPVMRADLTLIETHQYVPRELLSCPITAVGGTRDRAVSEAAIQGWQRHTRGPFTAHFIEGEHFFIQSNQAPWLALLNAELGQTG